MQASRVRFLCKGAKGFVPACAQQGETMTPLQIIAVVLGAWMYKKYREWK
jgi:hypothetical protein